MLFLEIGLKSHCATVVLLQICPYCWKAKAFEKLAAQLSFKSKLVTFVKKLRLAQNTVRNCPVARNWRQNTLRNRRFAPNWPVLLGSQSL